MANFPSAGAVVPDKIEEGKLPLVLRNIYTQIARNVAAQDRAIDSLRKGVGKDNSIFDMRVAHSLKGMAHNIEIIDTGNGVVGDVLYLVDQYHAMFGSASNPGSGGTTPSTLPADPASPSVLVNPGTGAAWATIPTRFLYLDANELSAATGSPLLGFQGSAYPNLYNAWDLPTTGQAAVGCMCEVPSDWKPTTALTLKVEWTTSAAAAQNWVPLIKYKERVDGEDMTAAATTITGPTTSANVTAHLKNTTTVGTLTPSGAGKVLRLMFERNPGGSDTYTGSIYLMALRIEYQAIY